MRTIVLLLIAAVLGTYLLLRPEAPVLPENAPDSLRTVNSGNLVGFADRAQTHAWLGIPYAASTARQGRWRAPRPAPSWEGVRSALSYSPPCPQPWSFFAGVEGKRGQVAGSENCLALNIWAPRFTPQDIPGPDEALPVMVWIHGGGNTVGSASGYPAAQFAGRENLLVVTINYRLGMLGWFSHPALRAQADNPKDASGNFGTLDTIAALEWVRDNIAAFGGNPNNVTIFGESAGGRNVFMLLASPLAEGLFHRAIVQSGSLNSMPRQFGENPVDAEQPGMPNSSGETLLRLLLERNIVPDRESAIAAVEDLTDKELAAFLRSRNLEDLFGSVGGPSGMYPAPQVFRDGHVIPRQPLTEVLADPTQYNSVPLVTGANRDEQKLFMAMDPQYSDKLFGVIPRILDQQSFDNKAAYYSDRWRLGAVDTPAQIISDHGDQPVFTYRWDWDEGGSLGIVDWSEALGAAHGLEIPFVLGHFDDFTPIPRLFTRANRKGREQLSQRMMSYWAQFARSGDPGRGTNADLPQWQPWQHNNGGIMVLDTEEDGGVRMDDSRLRVEDFRQRLMADTLITDQTERCALYLKLFHSPRRGKELFDPREYRQLGCE